MVKNDEDNSPFAEKTADNQSDLYGGRTDEQDNGSTIEWEASEFVVHSRPSWWYVAFILVTLGLAVGVYALLRDLFAVIVILIVFGLSYVIAIRKPRTLRYVIDDEGVTIGARLHPYDTFHSFSIVQDEGLQSIQLNPLQRFSLPIVIYFAPDDGAQIADKLSFHLPHEEREMSAVDKFSRNLRF